MTFDEIKTIKKRVEWCLLNIPNTRNSDKLLTIELWRKFYDAGETIRLLDIYELPSQDSIKRIRASFQSDEKYLPNSLEVVRKRRINEEVWRTAMTRLPL